MADYSLDISALSDANPYTNGDFTLQYGTSVQVASGVLKNNNSSSGAPVFYGYTAQSFTAPTIICGIKSNRTDAGSYDDTGPALIDSSGNGYWGAFDADVARIWRIDAGAEYTGGGGGGGSLASVSGLTIATTDLFTLEDTTGTGSLILKQNGTPILSTTDSTYTTGLYPKMGFIWSNSGAFGFIYYEATGVASGGSISFLNTNYFWGNY